MSQQNQAVEPVYLMDLVVENVRCFKDKQVMDLSDGNGKPAKWTIILGDNGTGKTTLLKCLAGLSIIKETQGYNIQSVNHSSVFLDFLQLHNSLALTGLKNTIKRNKSPLIALKNVFKRNEIIEVNLLVSKRSSGSLNINFPVVFETNLIAYGASRKKGEGFLTESKNIDNVASLFYENVNLINAEAWLLETDFAIKNAKGETKKYLQNHYKKVKEVLKKLLPDIKDFRIKRITKTERNAAIEVQTPYGWVAMKSLSLGYQTFIAWVVDLAARLFDRYPDSEKPLEEPCIVLVDEIDLHLHPKWQRKVISFLTDIFRNAQFIVTAHSPLIVQAAENANIVLLKREGNQVKIYNNKDEEVINGWRVDQVLTSNLFGLDSARPPHYDADLERKKQILKKEIISKNEEVELEQISKKLETWELSNEISNDALQALKQATAILKSK